MSSPEYYGIVLMVMGVLSLFLLFLRTLKPKRNICDHDYLILDDFENGEKKICCRKCLRQQMQAPEGCLFVWDDGEESPRNQAVEGYMNYGSQMDIN